MKAYWGAGKSCCEGSLRVRQVGPEWGQSEVQNGFKGLFGWQGCV